MMPKLDKHTDTSEERSQLRVRSYSTCLVEAVTGPVRRGTIHSVFRNAANILFPDGFLLSLNTLTAPRVPNSLQLSTCSGSFPFTDLRVGQPVLFGTTRLNIEALALSLDLTYCEQWNPKIVPLQRTDLSIIEKNGRWLVEYVGTPSSHPTPIPTLGYPQGGPVPWTNAFTQSTSSTVRVPLAGILRWGGQIEDGNVLNMPELAHQLCGRGPGLTPSGDDILLGWMAANWFLHGPQPHLLAAYQQILEIAERQTHLLSRCWLRYAADGYVAEPIGVLLQALAHDNVTKLLEATREVLSLGATSGLDVIHGILLGLASIP